MIFFSLGNCLSVAGTKYKTVSCRTFSSGCPAQFYWTYESYTRKIQRLFFPLQFIKFYNIGKISAKLHSNSTSIHLDNACQKINTQLHCYEMDPACQLQVPDEETEVHIMILGWTIAAVSLVVVLYFSVYFGMKFRGSVATCANSKYIFIVFFYILNIFIPRQISS